MHRQTSVLAKKYIPTVSPDEFDAISSALKRELQRKYDASKMDPDRPPANPATKGAFDHVPDLDSKTVARWSPTVKKHIGAKIDPQLIRKGGYDSFEAFWADVAPKLRAACEEAHTSGRAHLARAAR